MTDQIRWITCAVVTAILVLGYTFRERISDWKESLKAKVSKWLHDKVVDQSIEGDTATTSVGFLPVLVQFLDDHFLKPSVEEIEDVDEIKKENEDEDEKKVEKVEKVREVDGNDGDGEDDEDDDDEEEDDDEDAEEKEEEEEEEEEEDAGKAGKTVEEEEEFTVVDNDVVD